MRHHNNLPTVTLAVSVYNESENILPFLHSVLSQKEEGFRLTEILVVSDGSTDNTSEKVRSLKDPRIRLIEDPVRKGKSHRLNEIYAHLSTTYLVQTDADVIYSTPDVIKHMITPLIHDHEIGMCGGNPQPLPAVTFIEKAVNSTVDAYLTLRRSVRGGNNVLSADGRILSFRKDMVTAARIPETMIANDMYMYFYTITHGWKYQFVPQAIVSFRSPQTVSDQIRQNTRFVAAPIRMTKYFPADIVQKETYLPFVTYMKALILPVIQNPIGCISIALINRYCKIKAWYTESRLTAVWAMADTTKKLQILT